MQEIITNPTFRTIGGSLQLAISSQLGIRVHGFTDKEGNFQYFGFNPNRIDADGRIVSANLGGYVLFPPTMVLPQKDDDDMESGTLGKNCD